MAMENAIEKEYGIIKRRYWDKRKKLLAEMEAEVRAILPYTEGDLVEYGGELGVVTGIVADAFSFTIKAFIAKVKKDGTAGANYFPTYDDFLHRFNLVEKGKFPQYIKPK